MNGLSANPFTNQLLPKAPQMNNKQAEQTIVYNNILSNKKDAVLCFVDPYNVDLATKCVSFMEHNNGWEHV